MCVGFLAMTCTDVTHVGNLIGAMILCWQNLLMLSKVKSHNAADIGMPAVRLNDWVGMNNEVACTFRSNHISYFTYILGYQDGF